VALDYLIEITQRLWPHVPQIAAFDTAFHYSLPPKRYIYPLPYHWYTDLGIRRFGFHGLSFAYSTQRAAQLLDKPVEEIRLIICHLGSGASLAAIEGGRSIATTLGFTPLEGLMMATRSGSVDLGILLYLLAQHKQTTKGLDHSLNHESGLKGVTGLTGDMRDVLAVMSKGDERAVLGYQMYVDHVQQGIGALLAALGQIPDALVFTDGVAEHVAVLRADVMAALAWCGFKLSTQNNNSKTDLSPDIDIADLDSKIRILVIRVQEELQIAREVKKLLG
jgi:acetate kinase